MTTLAAKLPWTHAFAGGYPRVGGQPLPTDPDAIDYLARVAAADGAAVEVGVAIAVDAFIKGCKADGIWDAIKASCIMCGARTLSGALVPLVGTAPTNVANNFASGDYSRTTGLVGDGATKYLDTNRPQSSDPQDSFHMAVFGNGSGATLGYATAETGVSYITPGFSRSRRNSGQTWGVSPTANSFFGHSRSDASEYVVRVNGGYLAPFGTPSETPSNQNTLAFRIGAVYYSGSLAFYSIGSALDLAALDNRVSTLVAAIAAAI